VIPPNAEQGAQSAVLHAYQPRLDGSREGTCSVCLRPRHPDWPDYIASLEATVAQQAETIRGLTEQLAEARGHNGANIGNGQHPVHPEYGTCDAFADGGMCSECLRIMEQSHARAASVIRNARRLSAALKAMFQKGRNVARVKQVHLALLDLDTSLSYCDDQAQQQAGQQ
jgi:hypothetical protein